LGYTIPVFDKPPFFRMRRDPAQPKKVVKRLGLKRWKKIMEEREVSKAALKQGHASSSSGSMLERGLSTGSIPALNG